MKHLNIKISGDVQGVFFRHSAKAIAEKLGIKGFAINNPDGTVYIEVEGNEQQLADLIEWCKRGPSSARVDKIDVREGAMKNFSEFTING